MPERKSMGEELRKQRSSAISESLVRMRQRRKAAGWQSKAQRAMARGPILHPDACARIVIPADVLADRDRRAALEPVSITAAVCGDPPPGRSALDQKRMRQCSDA